MASTNKSTKSKPRTRDWLRRKFDEVFPTTSTWAKLGTALRALRDGAGLFPPLQSAIDALLPGIEILQEAKQNRKQFEELASELISLSEFLRERMKTSSPARMSNAIANVARSIEAQAKIISDRKERGTGRRLLEAQADEEEINRCYRQITSLFRQLQADATLSIWDIVNDQMMNTRLRELKPVELANYDSALSTEINRRACTTNTRTAILSGLNNWSHDPNGADLYWMNGMAGTGKTTIAYSFSESLDRANQLAASFFCTRTSPECREATRILPTIAYQLARYSIPFQSALCEILASEPDIGSKNITKQYERMLKAPLMKVKAAIPNDLVVVIDALDECDDMREVELLLANLLKSAADLPLRFFVTSRPEPEIYGRMLTRGLNSQNALHLHEIEKSLVEADIKLYLTEELEAASPTTAEIEHLARRAGNLFIYAATIVRYIGPRKRSVNPRERLKSALAMTSQPHMAHTEIDELYAAVLKAALDEGGLEKSEQERVRHVLQTALCVQEPVDVETITILAGLESEDQTLTALESLRSVIHFSETSGLVSTLHASFPDFMFEKARSGELFCDAAQRNQLLAERCFEIMKKQLRFNICNLESSFEPDAKVPDLKSRVNQAVSPALFYVCRYWGEHLRHSTYSEDMCAVLDEFLSVRMLFWMEVMNLKREIGMGVEVLLKAKLWLQTGAATSEMSRLAEDARNFVTSFAANPVSQSTPHIYVSLVPLCAKSSLVFKKYWRCGRMLNVQGSAMQKREGAALACWETESRVLSTSYSPDGTRIVSGSSDSTIRVWSSQDGTLVAGPFEGHTDYVRTVAYSPDGTRVASGSNDRTIRVWSSQDGTPVVGPLEGHTDAVTSAAYSPDGTRIVSGSDDCTIRVWSSQDGTLIAGPLEGHTGYVRSVAYSPDGTRIVSGSDDRTIRVWSSQDNKLVAGPLVGHTDSVRSVAYSPDGTRVVSSSVDDTIRVWSSQDSTLVASPFEGHTDSVRSAAYSPDGTHIVSGCIDNTIRVWSSQDGTLLASSFEGHDDYVTSVAYSPDGTRIVSGSDDCTIRVWSSQNGAFVVGPFEGHTDHVTSVAYSPDGTFIVSGSNDRTIRVWSSQDGALVASPFVGHTGYVLSVGCSPDGTRIVSGSSDSTLRVWSSQDGTLIAGPLEGHTDYVRSVAYSPDGTRIVSGSDDCTIRVWSSQDGTLVAGPLKGHADYVRSVAYSPDGTRVVSGSDDHTIRVWSGLDGTLVAGPFEGHTGYVRSVAYSPDGTRIVSGSDDRTIRVWSSQGITTITSPFKGHTGLISSEARSADDKHIASGSSHSATRQNSDSPAPKCHRDLVRVLKHPSLQRDGWFVNNDSQLLFWLPSDLANIFPSIHNPLVVSPSGSLLADYSNAPLGDRWTECYTTA